MIRLADGKPLQLGTTIQADARWRLFAFADRQRPDEASSRLRALCEFLGEARSPICRFTPPAADIDAVIDVRAVVQQGHRTLELKAMPPLLLPRKGRHGLVDYEKIFCPDPRASHDIFDLRDIDRNEGCALIVRPDQYIAQVLPLNAFDELASFFERLMLAA